MTYEPTEWKSGDVVTSQKLNKLENGVASASSGGGTASIILKISDPEGNYHWVIDSPVDFSTLMSTYWEYDTIDALQVDSGFEHAVNIGFYQGETPYISFEFLKIDLQDNYFSVVVDQYIWDGTTVTRLEKTGNITLS